MTSKRPFLLLSSVLAAAAVAGCGVPGTNSVAPTAETIAFLDLDPAQATRCVQVEEVVADGAAALLTGNSDAAVAAQVRGALGRCGALAGLIRPENFPAKDRPRALTCRSAFQAKTDAYTALHDALAAEGNFVAAQAGARRFMAEMKEARPLMERCNETGGAS